MWVTFWVWASQIQTPGTLAPFGFLPRCEGEGWGHGWVLTPSLSWGRGCRVVSCTGLSRQSPIPVAIYISSVIPCLLLALSLHKGTEVTVCLFFFFHFLCPIPVLLGLHSWRLQLHQLLFTQRYFGSGGLTCSVWGFFL